MSKHKHRNKVRQLSRGAIFKELAERNEMKPKQIKQVFESLSELVSDQITGKAQKVTIPNLVCIQVKHKKATKARKGKNPFTGEMMTFKAKPARDVVKTRPVKALKNMLA